MVDICERACNADYTVIAENGDKLELKQGEEYTTSSDYDELIVVFSRYWVAVPTELFIDD